MYCDDLNSSKQSNPQIKPTFCFIAKKIYAGLFLISKKLCSTSNEKNKESFFSEGIDKLRTNRIMNSEKILIIAWEGLKT